MTSYDVAAKTTGRASRARFRVRNPRDFAIGTLFWGVVVGVGVYWCVVWAQGGADAPLRWNDWTHVFLNIGRITGLACGYLALVEVLLLARLPFVERAVGFDRLTNWHRWNGHAVLWTALLHVIFSVWGFAREDFPPTSWTNEYWLMMTNGFYPGMIIATIGTVLVIAVAMTSLAVARRRLNYEVWYAIHFTAYAGIALAWYHEIPVGNELTPNVQVMAANVWRATYAATLALLLWYRLIFPAIQNFRYRLKVTEVVTEAPGVFSLRIAGRGLHRYKAKAGQFFFWRFLAPGFWYTQHPFSLSEAPKGDSFRITVKALGDHTAKLDQIKPGTRVIAEGPFGVFTSDTCSREKVLPIAGGIGITPIRAILEELHGDVITVYRAVSESDLVLSEELDALSAQYGGRVEYVVGDHSTPEGQRLLTAEHLHELVPDIKEREIYACGPPAMLALIERTLHRADLHGRHVHIENFAI